MANTITVTTRVSISGSNVAASMTGTNSNAQVGDGFVEETQVITTADAVALDINADIDEGDLGYLVIKHLGAKAEPYDPATANVIDIATDEPMTNKIATIYPEGSMFISPPGGTKALYAKASSADVQCVFLAVEI